MDTLQVPDLEAGEVTARPIWTGGRKSAFGWALYDWANSPFTTVVTTFIFAAYFAGAIAPDKTTGASQWAFTQGAAAFVMAILSPILGAIADHGKGRKAWIVFWTLVMVAASAALWWGAPGVDSTVLVLTAAFIGVIGFEMGLVFYNAMLPGLAPASHIGRLSGWSWGLGYIGGLACLVLLLFVFVQPQVAPFGLDKSAAEHIRIAGPIVAAWALVFSLPLFFLTADTPGAGLPMGRAVGAGLRTLGNTLANVRKHANIARFLIARIFYVDGLNTIFAVGAIYAATVFGMGTAEVLIFGIIVNVTAGLGAFAFAWLDDRLGAKSTVLLGVAGVTVCGIPMLFVGDKTWFYVLGGIMGLFFGPAQAASRSLMSHLAPRGQEAEMFGLYAFAGKCTAFLGPWIFGAVTLAAGPRWGMATVVPFLVIGAVILLKVDTGKVAPEEAVPE